MHRTHKVLPGCVWRENARGWWPALVRAEGGLVLKRIGGNTHDVWIKLTSLMRSCGESIDISRFSRYVASHWIFGVSAFYDTFTTNLHIYLGNRRVLLIQVVMTSWVDTWQHIYMQRTTSRQKPDARGAKIGVQTIGPQSPPVFIPILTFSWHKYTLNSFHFVVLRKPQRQEYTNTPDNSKNFALIAASSVPCRYTLSVCTTISATFWYEYTNIYDICGLVLVFLWQRNWTAHFQGVYCLFFSRHLARQDASYSTRQMLIIP